MTTVLVGGVVLSGGLRSVALVRSAGKASWLFPCGPGPAPGAGRPRRRPARRPPPARPAGRPVRRGPAGPGPLPARLVATSDTAIGGSGD